MTIKDIAKESGYSVGTVSRVLNNSTEVSDKARNAILEVVNKYHFQLNSNAKHLKMQNKNGIAIIIKGTQNMLFASIVEQMQGLIKKESYDSRFFYIDEDENEVEQAIQICRERKPLGILFLGSNLKYFKERFAEVDVPCVLVTNSAQELNFSNLSSVSTNDEEAANYVIKYLISLGHKNIAVLGGDTEVSIAALLREMGCRRAFQEKKIPYHPEKQYAVARFTMEDAYYSMNQLLDKMPELSAVFAMSDVMAIGAMRAIIDRGLRIPEDVSVVGFDGIDLARYLKPTLTTIRQNRENIAMKSVNILLEHIDDESKEAVHIVEPFRLVNGESTSIYI